MDETALDLFEDSYVVNPDNACWVWTGPRFPKGYGKFYVKPKSYTAHRWSYEHFVGPIPEGLVLDHLCRNVSCVNPHHVEPVTQQVNVLRGNSFAASNAKKTHCPNGHELIPENCLKAQLARGERQCRLCFNEYSRAWKAAKRTKAAL